MLIFAGTPYTSFPSDANQKGKRTRLRCGLRVGGVREGCRARRCGGAEGLGEGFARKDKKETKGAAGKREGCQH